MVELLPRAHLLSVRKLQKVGCSLFVEYRRVSTIDQALESQDLGGRVDV